MDKRAGNSKIIVETDCKNIIDSLKSSTTTLPDFRLIVNKCKHVLSCIQNSRVNFIKRQVNQVTHSLARFLDFMLALMFWIIYLLGVIDSFGSLLQKFC